METFGSTKAAHLKRVEARDFHLLVQLSPAPGRPPSVAAIFRLTFFSPNPLPQDDFHDRLNLSMSLGCPRHQAGRFMRRHFPTNFEDSGTRLACMAVESHKFPHDERKFAAARVKMNCLWKKCGRGFTAGVADFGPWRVTPANRGNHASCKT
jgi:hypothetical protein